MIQLSRYQELFNKSADASLVIQDNRFVDCNQATVDMLGYESKEPILNTHPSKLSPEFQPDGRDSISKADEMMAIALEKGSHRFEWDHVRANGEVFPVEVLLTLISESEEGQTIFVVWRDISEAVATRRFQEANLQLATSLGTTNDMKRIAHMGAAVIREYFHSDAIAINFIDAENRINLGLYAEDTAEGESEPSECPPLFTPFDELDTDSIHGIPEPKLLNRTPEQIQQKPMDRPFGVVERRSASLMFAPIEYGNTKMGEVTAQSYTFNKFDEKNLEELQVIASRIGAALIRAKTSNDLRREHEELLKKQAQLLTSQRLAHIGNWEHDLETDERQWSDELYRIFDIDPGTPITIELIHERIHPADLETFIRENEDPGEKTDYRVVHRSGEIRWIHELVDAPIIENGKPVSLRGTAQDITEAKEAEKRLAETDSLRELLLDVITHDLKNPAGALLNLTALAQEGTPDPTLLEVIHDSSQRLLKTLEDTSLLAKATFGEEIPKEDLDLRTLLVEVVSDFGPKLRLAKMEVDLQVPGGVLVRANPLIAEVFKNYLSNALRYAPDSQVIRIRSQQAEDNILVSVQDQGNTIPELDRERVFERQVQLSKEGKRGRGIGLAIVKRIAEAHDGRVWVEPNEPRGNKFLIRIPLAQTT